MSTAVTKKPVQLQGDEANIAGKWEAEWWNGESLQLAVKKYLASACSPSKRNSLGPEKESPLLEGMDQQPQMAFNESG